MSGKHNWWHRKLCFKKSERGTPIIAKRRDMIPKNKRRIQMQPQARRIPMCPAIDKGENRQAYALPGIMNQLRDTKGKGRMLPSGIQQGMTSKLGTNFKNVNIHTGNKAVQMSQHLGARAFNKGDDIYFNAHQYAPQSRAGKRLLAHELSHTIQQKSLGQRIQMMQPCPPTLMESEDPPDGFQDYHGNSCIFHCCYRGILEDVVPEPDDPQNECFYDSYGRLVDENHENADCGGTPNEYDSDRDPLKHTFWDEGGIVFSGWSAFWESRYRSEDRSDRGRALAHEECVRRLGGCPEYRPVGIPTLEEIETYNDQCRSESNYEGPNITPECD